MPVKKSSYPLFHIPLSHNHTAPRVHTPLIYIHPATLILLYCGRVRGVGDTTIARGGGGYDTTAPRALRSI